MISTPSLLSWSVTTSVSAVSTFFTLHHFHAKTSADVEVGGEEKRVGSSALLSKE